MTPREQVQAVSLGNARDHRGEARRSDDSDPGTVTVKGPGVSAKVTPRILVPSVLAVVTAVGGVTWWQAKPAEPAAPHHEKQRTETKEELARLDWRVSILEKERAEDRARFRRMEDTMTDIRVSMARLAGRQPRAKRTEENE